MDSLYWFWLEQLLGLGSWNHQNQERRNLYSTPSLSMLIMKRSNTTMRGFPVFSLKLWMQTRVAEDHQILALDWMESPLVMLLVLTLDGWKEMYWQSRDGGGDRHGNLQLSCWSGARGWKKDMKTRSCYRLYIFSAICDQCPVRARWAVRWSARLQSLPPSC